MKKVKLLSFSLFLMVCSRSLAQSNENEFKMDTSLILKHYIGEEYGGGVIFKLWKDENYIEHGLIVSKNEIDDKVIWSNIFDSLAVNIENKTLNGDMLTELIIKQNGHSTSAAQICRNVSYMGFNDWYLPSYSEMCDLINNVYKINFVLSMSKKSQIIALNEFYWTSTEFDNLHVYACRYDLPIEIEVEYLSKEAKKSNFYKVRPIRSF